MKFATKIMMLLLIVFLMACSKQLESGKLIHEEQTTTSGQWVGGSTVIVAYNDKEFEDLWNSFNIEENRPDVNFDKDAILFAHTMENSCPKQISKFQLSDDGKKLIIETSQKGSYCNDIGIPKLFVFQMEKDMLDRVETISFEGKSFAHR
ncbi:hypothetical protein [Aeribacillus pallidus]|uniref:hypothetical protein n=1 Tax=Aeribacillus pallidus TaxID=33936 RepID=UPI003D1C1A59